MAFTFFFRDSHILEHAAKVLAAEAMGRSRIHVWDAGCAMGPEPYTLAIILAEKMGPFSFKNVIITASDIDETDTFGKIIQDAVYPEDELKRIPEDIFAKYFIPCSDKPGFYSLCSLIKDRVRFVKHDLLSLNPVGSGFSLIICKNVLLHFQQNERIEVIKMFNNSLAADGFFATEHTQKMPEELQNLFEQVVSDAQLYRKAK